jgi:hypothetical protein
MKEVNSNNYVKSICCQTILNTMRYSSGSTISEMNEQACGRDLMLPELLIKVKVRIPFPVLYLRHILTIFVNVFFMFNQLILHKLA